MSKNDEPKIAIKREQSSLLELSSVSDLSNAMELAPIAEARMIFEAKLPLDLWSLGLPRKIGYALFIYTRARGG